LYKSHSNSTTGLIQQEENALIFYQLHHKAEKNLIKNSKLISQPSLKWDITKQTQIHNKSRYCTKTNHISNPQLPRTWQVISTYTLPNNRDYECSNIDCAKTWQVDCAFNANCCTQTNSSIKQTTNYTCLLPY
jgi:hypothetical protein